jgi:hypothetical protein
MCQKKQIQSILLQVIALKKWQRAMYKSTLWYNDKEMANKWYWQWRQVRRNSMKMEQSTVKFYYIYYINKSMYMNKEQITCHYNTYYHLFMKCIRHVYIHMSSNINIPCTIPLYNTRVSVPLNLLANFATCFYPSTLSLYFLPSFLSLTSFQRFRDDKMRKMNSYCKQFILSHF